MNELRNKPSNQSKLCLMPKSSVRPRISLNKEISKKLLKTNMRERYAIVLKMNKIDLKISIRRNSTKRRMSSIGVRMRGVKPIIKSAKIFNSQS